MHTIVYNRYRSLNTIIDAETTRFTYNRTLIGRCDLSSIVVRWLIYIIRLCIFFLLYWFYVPRALRTRSILVRDLRIFRIFTHTGNYARYIRTHLLRLITRTSRRLAGEYSEPLRTKSAKSSQNYMPRRPSIIPSDKSVISVAQKYKIYKNTMYGGVCTTHRWRTQCILKSVRSALFREHCGRAKIKTRVAAMFAGADNRNFIIKLHTSPLMYSFIIRPRLCVNIEAHNIRKRDPFDRRR